MLNMSTLEKREAATVIRRLIDKMTVIPTKDGTDAKIDGLIGLLVVAINQELSLII